MSDAAYAIADRYGVQYSGTLVGPEYHDGVNYTRTYTLAEVAAARGKITRLRLLGDEGRDRWVSVSYIHATLPTGETVPVRHELPSMFHFWETKHLLVEWARSANVYGKGLGLLDETNWSVVF